MRKIYLLLVFCLNVHFAYTQNISFEMTSEGVLSDADVGDMEFGDIDNDGDLDLLITGKGGPIRTVLYENDGSGNLTEIPGTPFLNFFSSKVGFIDVNNNGSLDILIMGFASPGGALTQLYLNDGLGNYSLDTTTPFQNSDAGDFTFDDMNGDGIKDILMVGRDGSGNGFTKLYLNFGAGNFTEFTGALPFLQLKFSTIELIDIENDNDQDVLLVGEANSGTKHSVLYENNGLGNFTLVTGTPFDNCSGGDIDVGDSDNDGDFDVLISGNNDNGEIISKLYLNDGTGGFTHSTSTLLAVSVVGESHFADFDGDGDADICIIGVGPNGVQPVNDIIANVYENLGGNNFILADSLIGAYISTAAIGDIDGDNDLDIAIGGTSEGSPVRVTRLYTNVNTGEINSQLDRECITLFDNPTVNSFKVQGFISNYTVEIVDGSGTVIQDLGTDFNKSIIDIPSLPPGQLLLRVVNTTDGAVYTEINLQGF